MIQREIYRNSNIPWLLAIFLLFIFYTNAYSQNDNYWSWNFNTSSVLLAGSVVAGNAGFSSVFYNPALIRGDMQSFSISASLLSLQSFKVDNAAGTGIDINKFLLKIQPRFISKVFTTKNEKIILEAAFLSPVSESSNFSIQHFDKRELINRTQGLETYSGYLKYERNYDDFFIGLGGSYKLNENLSIGMSSFVSVKFMKYNYQQSFSAFQETDTVIIEGMEEPSYIAQENFKEDLKFWDLDFIFKLGLQYKLMNGKFNLGLNITLPNLSIYGEGEIRIEKERSNIFNNESGEFTPNKNEIEISEKVRTNVKSPFSIALGLLYFLNSHNDIISLTAEYFHSIDSYNLFSTEADVHINSNLVDQTLTDKFFQPYISQSKSLTNWAVGFKKYVSPNLDLLIGFRTDFTNKSNESESQLNYENHNLGSIHFDKYHLTFGTDFKIKTFNIVTGIQYSHGSRKNMTQLVNFSNPIEYNPNLDISLQGIREDNATLKLNEIALFFGINF